MTVCQAGQKEGYGGSTRNSKTVDFKKGNNNRYFYNVNVILYILNFSSEFWNVLAKGYYIITKFILAMYKFNVLRFCGIAEIKEVSRLSGRKTVQIIVGNQLHFMKIYKKCRFHKINGINKQLWYHFISSIMKHTSLLRNQTHSVVCSASKLITFTLIHFVCQLFTKKKSSRVP